jgi:ankyrin repeat protein
MLGRRLDIGFCTLLLASAASGLLIADSSVGERDGRLSKAAKDGDREAVRVLLKQKVDVNEAQGDGMTALHWAALNDDLEMVQMLLQSGASVKVATRISADTPLFFAAKNGDAAVVDALLKAGADPRLTGKTGTTPLMMAAASGGVESVKAILDHAADINAVEEGHGQTALMFAAALDRSDVVKTLLARGADCKIASKTVKLGKPVQYGSTEDTPEDGGGRGGRGGGRGGSKVVVADEDRISGAGFMGGMTALLFAARDGHIRTVRELVEGGCDVNEVSADKTSPLVMAIQNGHYDVGKYLLGHRADPNLANESGLAGLYATIDVQYAPLGWAPNPITTQETTSYLELMKDLMEQGANPNARLTKKLWFRSLTHNVGWVDSTGSTALWRAAQSVDVAAMRLLIAHGADPNIPAKAGATPLMVAAGIGWGANFTLSAPAPDSWMEAVKYLVELGCDVNAQDSRGYTALGGAAFRGNNEMVKYLIGRGAKVDIVAKDGNTITDMANGIFEHAIPRPETVALLEKLGSANSHNCRSNQCLVAPKEDTKKTPVSEPPSKK